MAASILTSLDNPITKEDLIKMGFKIKLCKADIDVRYDLANMSDDSIIKMVKENTYYEKIISDHYQIKIIYYPSTYYEVHHTVDFGELLHNYNCNYEKKPYNLEITSERIGGTRYNPNAEHKIWIEDLKDLTDYVYIAKLESRKFSGDYDEDLLGIVKNEII